MKYQQEKTFILQAMKSGFDLHGKSSIKKIVNKSKFDLVTEVDENIELYIIDKIKQQFPHDYILSEETLSQQEIKQRVWTIDPIDGTCNMANGSKLYGVQCALIEDNKIVLGAIWLPHLNEEYYAISGSGAFLNDQPITVAHDVSTNNAIVSYGDYSHNSASSASLQHASIGTLYPKIAKIRMFGAACMDFSFVAAGRSTATVVLTKNIWDIAPGIILCTEAGAMVSNMTGGNYCIGDFGVVASANDTLHHMILSSLEQH